MTCHVARRLGEFERRPRRDRGEICDALLTTDTELAGLEPPHHGDVIDEAVRETTRREDIRCLRGMHAADRSERTRR
jgi:hypothetical protein